MLTLMPLIRMAASKKLYYHLSYSCLHLASSHGFFEMAETILLNRARIIREHGKQSVFEIDCEDSLTLTPLMKASTNGHIEVNNFLAI